MKTAGGPHLGALRSDERGESPSRNRGLIMTLRFINRSLTEAKVDTLSAVSDEPFYSPHYKPRRDSAALASRSG